MFTSKVWTDDRKLLRESNLTATQGATSRHKAITSEGLAQARGLYVVARFGLWQVTFRTEGTEHHYWATTPLYIYIAPLAVNIDQKRFQ